MEIVYKSPQRLLNSFKERYYMTERKRERNSEIEREMPRYTYMYWTDLILLALETSLQLPLNI